MLKIWGRNTSSNVQKVLWCAEELGLPFERVDIGGPFGGNKEPAYLALNPNGLIPTVEDDGLVLWESNAILRYLAAKHPKPALLPTAPGPRALIERWMDWQLTVLNAPMIQVYVQLIRTPPEKRDPAAIETGRKGSAAAWTILDAHLKGRDFIGGAEFTLADIVCGLFTWRWFNLPIERPELPDLRAWYDRLRARPGYQKYVATEMK